MRCGARGWPHFRGDSHSALPLKRTDSRVCALSVETGSATPKKKFSPAAVFSLPRPSNSTTGRGKVRDLIAESIKRWLGTLEQAVRDAQSAGEIRKNIVPQDFVFEIQSLAMGANWASRLFRDDGAFRRIRRAILERIDQVIEPHTRR